MQDILIWIAAIIAIEAIIEIEVESVLFQGLRSRLADVKGRLGWYLNGLFSCGYCLSVWVSMLGALVVPQIGTKYWITDFVIKVFLLHRLSNIWHELLKRWFDRIPIILAFKPEDFSEGGTIEVLPDDNERREETEEDSRASPDSGYASQERDGAEEHSQELRSGPKFPREKGADGGIREDQASDGGKQEA